MASLTNYANAEFAASNIPIKYKSRKVCAVRTFPEVFKQVTTHINQPTNESLDFVDTVNNSSFKNDSVCDQEDQEDDPFEPLELDDLESQENLLTNQIHILSNDLASGKVGLESVSNIQETNSCNVELPEAFDDGKFICQTETQVRENIDLETTFPKRKVPVIRDFPTAFDQISRRKNLIVDEVMTSVETVQDLNKNEITGKLESSFESFGNDLDLEENFGHEEMHDLSNDSEFEMSKALDNEDLCDKLNTSGDKPAIHLPKRSVSVIRFFPPGCGRNAAHISKEDTVKFIEKELFFEAEGDTKQVRVKAQGEDIEVFSDNTNNMNQNKVGVCLDTSESKEKNVVGSEQARVIVQALVASPRCPWRRSKRASTPKPE